MPQLQIDTTSHVLDIVKIVDLGEPRDPGKHVTGLLNLGERLAGKKPYPENEGSSEIMAMGQLWEWAVRPYIEKKVKDWGFETVVFSVKMEKEGIIGNLDGLLIGVDRNAVVETKLRFSPPREDFPLGHERYMLQTKTYCAMAGVNLVCMPVLHLNTRPPRATFKVYWLEFNPVEVQENWAMMQNLRDYEE